MCSTFDFEFGNIIKETYQIAAFPIIRTLLKSITRDFMKFILRNHLRVIHEEPLFKANPDLYGIDLSQDDMILSADSPSRLTKELCDIAIKQNGYALKYLPKRFRTQELCERAINTFGGAIKYVPISMRTQALCKTAISQNSHLLGSVPKSMLTPEICRIALNRDGKALDSVPDDMRTQKLYEINVTMDSSSYRKACALRSLMIAKSAMIL